MFNSGIFWNCIAFDWCFLNKICNQICFTYITKLIFVETKVKVRIFISILKNQIGLLSILNIQYASISSQKKRVSCVANVYFITHPIYYIICSADWVQMKLALATIRYQTNQNKYKNIKKLIKNNNPLL